MPLFSLRHFVQAGMLAESALPALRELRQVNPLMFDFVLKRSLAWQGARLPASVFETRPFFSAAGSS
jgi:mannonate dehydratase